MTQYARYQQVYEYIEQNLDDDLSIPVLSAVAAVSKFHFHRQSQIYLGMPVSKLVRLLRLKRAAHQLAYHKAPILDVALDNGYESQASFSRVFKDYFQQTPAEFRANPDWQFWLNQYQPQPPARKHNMSHPKYTVELLNCESIDVAVMSHQGSPMQLPQTIQRFIEWRKLNRLPPSNNRTFNFVYSDPNTTPAEEYRFDLATDFPIQHANTLEPSMHEHGLQFVSIPKGLYARVRHQGSDSRLGDVLAYLLSDWIEQQPYQLADFPIVFERINMYPEFTESEQVTDVLLALTT
jgi:AraC family transcriptional regulator